MCEDDINLSISTHEQMKQDNKLLTWILNEIKRSNNICSIVVSIQSKGVTLAYVPTN